MHIVECLQTFDFPDRFQPVGRRLVSTRAPQLLYLVNGQVVAGETERLANRRINVAPATNADRVTLPYQRLYGRFPTDTEVQAAVEYVSGLEKSLTSHSPERDARLSAWQSLVQKIVTANEFVYTEVRAATVGQRSQCDEPRRIRTTPGCWPSFCCTTTTS
jgi:hypothetical protein